MATDMLARGLAAQTRDGALPSLPRLANLSAYVVPRASDRVAVGSGAAGGLYIADARATSALAAAHPRFCKADAAGRYFRLLPDNGTIDPAQGGMTGSGNQQPAWQAAINYAVAIDCPTVRASIGGAYEMWCPVWTGTYFVDGTPVMVRNARRLTLDFGGAKITLKGPTGNADRTVGQTLHDPASDAGKLWMGGWCCVIGSDLLEYFALENVEVNGGYTDDGSDRTVVNLSDKAVWIQNSHADRFVLRNVTCHGFRGEICYLGGERSSTGKSIDYLIENCHFHHSPQAAFNPQGHGRLTAINLQAGKSYIAAEVLGGAGQDYIGCRFYDASQAAFFGGPDPDFAAGHYYDYPNRLTDSAPPFINFHATRLERCGGLGLHSWARGTIVAIDTAIGIGGKNPSDVMLDIESWADRGSLSSGFDLGSDAVTLTTQMPYPEPAGTYFEPPANIHVRIVCKRTKLAKSRGDRHIIAASLYGGSLYDHTTIRVEVSGEAERDWMVQGTPVAGFRLPLMVAAPGFQRLVSGIQDASNGDRTYKPSWGTMTLVPTSAGTHNVTLDPYSFSYVTGQRIVFRNWSGDAARIMSFGKNGYGLALNADRTLRRLHEYLELEWDVVSLKWREVACLDQGA